MCQLNWLGMIAPSHGYHKVKRRLNEWLSLCSLSPTRMDIGIRKGRHVERMLPTHLVNTLEMIAPSHGYHEVKPRRNEGLSCFPPLPPLTDIGIQSSHLQRLCRNHLSPYRKEVANAFGKFLRVLPKEQVSASPTNRNHVPPYRQQIAIVFVPIKNLRIANTSG